MTPDLHSLTQAYLLYQHAEQDVAELTRLASKIDLTNFGDWFTGKPTPPALNAATLRAYRADLQARGYAPSTINRKLTALRACFRWAHATGWLETNPAERLSLLPMPPQQPRWLDAAQQAQLLRADDQALQWSYQHHPLRCRTRQRDSSLLRLLLFTGLRVSEMTALALDDLQLGERTGLLTVRHGKGNKQRSVPLNAAARRSLQAWFGVRPEGSAPYVFVPLENEGGPALTPRSVQRIIRRMGSDAQLPDLTPHTLRHTFAKNLVDSGSSLEKVAALLGHSNLNTTRIYVSPGTRDLEHAVAALSDDE